MIYDSLDRDLYNVYKVVVLKEEWYFLNENEEKLPINKGDFSVTLSDGAILNLTFVSTLFTVLLAKMVNYKAIGTLLVKNIQAVISTKRSYFQQKDTLAVLAKYGIPSAKSFTWEKEKILMKIKL